MNFNLVLHYYCTFCVTGGISHFSPSAMTSKSLHGVGTLYILNNIDLQDWKKVSLFQILIAGLLKIFAQNII